MESTDFYDQLTPFYHLVYEDWEASITSQAAALDSIIKKQLGHPVTSILDVACGVGMQWLGLASLGYDVIASDRSARVAGFFRTNGATTGPVQMGNRIFTLAVWWDAVQVSRYKLDGEKHIAQPVEEAWRFLNYIKLTLEEHFL